MDCRTMASSSRRFFGFNRKSEPRWSGGRPRRQSVPSTRRCWAMRTGIGTFASPLTDASDSCRLCQFYSGRARTGPMTTFSGSGFRLWAKCSGETSGVEACVRLSFSRLSAPTSITWGSGTGSSAAARGRMFVLGALGARGDLLVVRRESLRFTLPGRSCATLKQGALPRLHCEPPGHPRPRVQMSRRSR